MITNQLDVLYNQIIKESLELIKSKKIDLDELAFKIGISSERLKKALLSRDEDFSIYFRAYDLLLEW